MIPNNNDSIQKSFTTQAGTFENNSMNFSNQKYLDYTIKRMELKSTDKVLEAAAGTCVCARRLAPFAGHITCLDATPAMLAVGKAKAAEEKLGNIDFVNGYVEDLPFESHSFDVVLSRLAFSQFTIRLVLFRSSFIMRTFSNSIT